MRGGKMPKSEKSFSAKFTGLSAADLWHLRQFAMKIEKAPEVSCMSKEMKWFCAEKDCYEEPQEDQALCSTHYQAAWSGFIKEVSND